MFSLLGRRRELASIVFLFRSRPVLSGQFVGIYASQTGEVERNVQKSAATQRMFCFRCISGWRDISTAAAEGERLPRI